MMRSNQADLRMRIINADGSEAEMCGNGVRCFAKYVFEKGIVKKNRFGVETISGVVEAELIIDNDKISAVKIDMGKPSFLLTDKNEKIINYQINIAETNYHITSLDIGVPHTIIFVENIDKKELAKIGSLIENHKLFPKKN